MITKEDAVLEGHVYIYESSGREYEVISSNSRMKLPDGTWTDSIVYVPICSNIINMFVRTVDNFKENFVEKDITIEL